MTQKPDLSFWKLWNLSFGFFGVQIAYALQSANISRIFATLGADPHNLSYFWILPPLMGILVQPIVGTLSDKTWCRFGRRIPYLFIGASVAVLVMCLLPNAGSFGLTVSGAMLFGLIALMFLDTSINIDFQQAVTEALDYLYDLGHRKIAYLGGKEVLADNSVYFEERKDTFINFCQEHSINHESFIYEGDYSAESGYNMTKQMIADGDLPTAIFSASDPLAIGAMRALYENGYKIPDDISIIGFDDISVASFSNPPLTTIHTPAEFMGEYAAHYILLRTKEDSLNQQTPIRLTLPCNLIVRNSCAAPRKQS